MRPFKAPVAITCPGGAAVLDIGSAIAELGDCADQLEAARGLLKTSQVLKIGRNGDVIVARDASHIHILLQHLSGASKIRVIPKIDVELLA